MGYIDADDLKSKVDIMDVVSDYMMLKKSGVNHFGLCPFHSEKTPSFSVNPSLQTFRCFGCGKSGNVFAFIMEIEEVGFYEALHIVKNRIGYDEGAINIQPSIKKQNEVTRKLDDKSLDLISRELQSVLTLIPEHQEILMSPERGMSLDEIKARGYRSFPEKPWEPFSKLTRKNFEGFPGAYLATSNKGSGRDYWTLKGYGRGGILIPIHNERNYIVGWQIRLDKVPNVASFDTEFKDKFNAHLNRDGMLQVTWDGEIIAEIPEDSLTIGEERAITVINNNQKLVLGKVGIKKGQKYFWLSSPNKPKGVAAGNPIPVHIALPCEIRKKINPGQLIKAKKCWITEGPIKADISAEKVGDVFIGVPGLSAWRMALEAIINMGIEHVILAYDMDIARKDELRDQIKNFKEELLKMEQIKQCDVALWNEENHGKGIDDMLLKGHFPVIRTLFKK